MAEPINLSLAQWIGWAEGRTSSIAFTRWCQYSLPRGHIGATWRILLNRPFVAAMRSFAKILWPLDTCCHPVVNMARTKPIIIYISHKKKTLYSYFTMQILHNFQNSFTYSLSSKMCNKVTINKSTTCHTLLHYLSALWNINVQKLTIWNRHCDHIAWWYIWGVVGFLNCRRVYAEKLGNRRTTDESLDKKADWLTHLIPGHQGNVLPRTCPHGVWRTANVTAAANNSILISSLGRKLA